MKLQKIGGGLFALFLLASVILFICVTYLTVKDYFPPFLQLGWSGEVVYHVYPGAEFRIKGDGGGGGTPAAPTFSVTGDVPPSKIDKMKPLAAK